METSNFNVFISHEVCSQISLETPFALPVKHDASQLGNDAVFSDVIITLFFFKENN